MQIDAERSILKITPAFVEGYCSALSAVFNEGHLTSGWAYPNITMADSTPIVNPDTPLAFLDPETAYQTSVAVYVLAGSLGVSNSWFGS
jgi:hypothetical protein